MWLPPRLREQHDQPDRELSLPAPRTGPALSPRRGHWDPGSIALISLLSGGVHRAEDAVDDAPGPVDHERPGPRAGRISAVRGRVLDTG
jgi:hypothetical protein